MLVVLDRDREASADGLNRDRAGRGVLVKRDTWLHVGQHDPDLRRLEQRPGITPACVFLGEALDLVRE